MNIRIPILMLLGLMGVIYFAWQPTAAASPKNMPLLDQVVATVNDEAIAESELQRQVDLLLVRMKQSDIAIPPLSTLKKQLLDKMVLDKLQIQIATKTGITIEASELEKTLGDMAKHDNITVEQMRGFLENQGVSFKEFQETIKKEMMIARLQQREIWPQIRVSKADIEHFLKLNANQDQVGTEYHIGHILVALPEHPSAEKEKAVEKEAKAVLAELQRGGDFSAVAFKKSKSSEALNGGDLGWKTVSELPTLFAEIAPSLKVNEVHGLIKNSSGFHIIKLYNKRAKKEETALVQVKKSKDDLAKEAVFQRKFEEAVASWLRKIRDDAEIGVYLQETA